ncbi:unnamed protein product [Cuscuta epithymum]|uniref:Lipoxygenase n=1 Tax=Cuscuta epithymum TaxID=186058 RepID=A0AAV0CC03_9ASTE|nr:unnamed protein product [Cuscuta epithymum]
MSIQQLVDTLTCMKKLKGTVVLKRKNVLGLNDVSASIVDNVSDFLGEKVSIELISTTQMDHANASIGKRSQAAYLENWVLKNVLLAEGESAFQVTFEWTEDFGVPGAFIIKNNHPNEFFLKTLTLEDVPSHGQVHFVCFSWVYPASKYHYDRVFFANQAYLPSQTPAALQQYRDNELVNLRGSGTGELKEWDRVYDYDYYNDLGEPDKGPEYARPVLGGNSESPYPRRGRTGRPHTKTDPKCESRVPLISSLDLYVPRDEKHGEVKVAYSLAHALMILPQFFHPEFMSLFDSTPNEFDSFQDILSLYEEGIKLPQVPLQQFITNSVPFEMLKEICSAGESLFKFPNPQVILEDKTAWRSDEEFGRQMLAGMHPVIISGLQEFPPKSILDLKVYGDHTSKITKEHIQKNLDSFSVEEAIKNKRLFIVNYHDTLMPYLRHINATKNKVYASRTLLYLKTDGTLKPVAIELSLPHPLGDKFGTDSKVYTPSENGVDYELWQLAKAYAAVNDAGFHQLISHWLNTHAVIEPFVIAKNRQLSTLHPIHKLLHPHFRDTMATNALARQVLLNAGGVLEKAAFFDKYAMEICAVVYKDWVFTDQALPADLVKRGVAVEDSCSPHGVRLLIEDYPYAVDGLEVWSYIKAWVDEYCNLYYKSDNMVQKDAELQAWWKEVREKGHGDLKEKPWWPKMQTIQQLIDSCTIIIWIASALHAAINYGLYSYGGYPPNHPLISQRFMPEPGTAAYEELEADPDKVFLKTITPQYQALLSMSLNELLSRHTPDELYLGQRECPEWTKDKEALDAFVRFGKKVDDIGDHIIKLNTEGKLKNRTGPVKIPYTLLFPSSKPGLTGKGIPNSVTI